MGFIRDHIGNLLGNTLVAPSDGYEQELAAVLALKARVGPQDAVDLVSYAHGEEVPAAEKAIAEVAAKHIESWQDEHEALGRRIAAAAVISLYEEETTDAAVSAVLACLSASFVSLSPVVADLHSRMTGALAHLADARRAVTITRPSVQPFPPSKSPELPADDPATTPTNQQLRGFLHADRVAIRSAANNLNTRITSLERLARRNSEEIDLLWWSLSPFSDHTEDWASAGESAVLLVGLETARRMVLEPPARGLGALVVNAMDRAGVDPRKGLLLSSAVAAFPASALEDPDLPSQGSFWATPILQAVSARRANAIPKQESGVRAPGLQIAVQLVRELSLMRILKREMEAQ